MGPILLSFLRRFRFWAPFRPLSLNWSISLPFRIPPTHKNSQIMLHQDINFTDLFQAFNVTILRPQQPFLVINATLLQYFSEDVIFLCVHVSIVSNPSSLSFYFYFFKVSFVASSRHFLWSSPWFLQGIFEVIFSSLSNLKTSSSFHLEFERWCQRYVNPM